MLLLIKLQLLVQAYYVPLINSFRSNECLFLKDLFVWRCYQKQRCSVLLLFEGVLLAHCTGSGSRGGTCPLLKFSVRGTSTLYNSKLISFRGGKPSPLNPKFFIPVPLKIFKLPLPLLTWHIGIKKQKEREKEKNCAMSRMPLKVAAAHLGILCLQRWWIIMSIDDWVLSCWYKRLGDIKNFNNLLNM